MCTSNRVVLVSGVLFAVACGGGGGAKPDRGLERLEETPKRQAPVPEASDLVTQGEQKLQAGDAAGAATLFEQAIAANPSDARAHLDLGIARELQEDFAGAAESYRAALEIQPDFPEALNNLGVLLRDAGQLGEAVPILERAVAANPASASVHMNLALALEDGGEDQRAAASYRKSLEIEPGEVMTRANLGLLLVRLGEPQEAARHLKEAARGAAGNRAALLAIGNGLRRTDDKAAAVQALQAAIAAGDGKPTPALLSELAVAQLAAKDRDTAIATLDQALKLDAGYATAHFLLGGMHAAAARKAPAKKHYKRYLKLEPNGPMADKARRNLERLK